LVVADGRSCDTEAKAKPIFAPVSQDVWDKTFSTEINDLDE